MTARTLTGFRLRSGCACGCGPPEACEVELTIGESFPDEALDYAAHVPLYRLGDGPATELVTIKFSDVVRIMVELWPEEARAGHLVARPGRENVLMTFDEVMRVYSRPDFPRDGPMPGTG